MKLVCFQHFATHYRRTLFLKMQNELGCHFIFGSHYAEPQKSIKILSPSEFRLFDFAPRNRVFVHLPFYWQQGVGKALFHGYTHWIMLGDLFCLSTWLLAFALLFCPHKKLYFWTHGWYGREGRLKKIIKKLFFKMADGLFLYGSYARNLMIREGFDEKKLFVIHNSLDLETQTEIFKTLSPRPFFKEHFRNDCPTILFVGRLTEVKHLDMLLGAIKTMEEKEVKANLVLIGDGPERESLENLARKNGILDRVWFYGACYEEKEMAPLIYHATLCVSPGEVGLTAMHAMGYGCPVITHNDFAHQMPEFEAITPGKTGDFFRRGDAADLTKVLLRDLAAFSENRAAMREACRKEITERWSPEYQLEQLKKGLGIRQGCERAQK